ncbi:MAG: TetR/AcrR family transcriptional regulator [Proteobacteria bacterium]|nr:TetR/AcrR family transcriptional regulator [Pseudomonadota bacterium]
MAQSKKSPAKTTPAKSGKTQSKGNKKETREKILAAARHVFSNYPYHSATIRTIGKLAGIEHPLISYYFPTKADLFISVLGKVYERQTQLEKQWLEEVKSMTPARGLSIYLDHQLDHFRRHPEILHIITLNMVQSEDSEPIPGYDRILDSVGKSVKIFMETVDLSAPEYEIEMFCRVMFNHLLNFLGASTFHAASLKLDPNSIQYLNWVKDAALYTLLPRLKTMVKRAGSPPK